MKSRATCSVTLTVVSILSLLFASGDTGAQTLSGAPLVNALKKGGFVIVMRHASSPRDVPDERTANPDDSPRERQLDETGRSTAVAMGKAVRELAIPIGEVFSSPTYRARETVRLAQLGQPKLVDELGDRGKSMQGVTDEDAAWLRNKVMQLPKGANTILMTHMPNLQRAFPQSAAGVADGEALVFGPGSNGTSTVVARVKIEDWPGMR
jgi:phosphohistidine phosphatase SixA